MTRSLRLLGAILIVAAIQVLVACSPTTSMMGQQWQPAMLSDFSSVAGTWDGRLLQTPRSNRDDWLTVRISESGAFEFTSARQTGVMRGKGNFMLVDGTLEAKTPKGEPITVKLYRDPGSNQRMLKAEAKASNGLRFTADLLPAVGSAPR